MARVTGLEPVLSQSKSLSDVGREKSNAGLDQETLGLKLGTDQSSTAKPGQVPDAQNPVPVSPGAQYEHNDSGNLERVVKAWPSLPLAIQRAMIALIEST